jgi:membrane protein required for colicin V production
MVTTVNWADYIIIAVVGLSVLIGVWRGLISEVLALGIWILAFWVSWTFGPTVSTYFDHKIDLPSARIAVGYGICFTAVLIAGVLVRFLIGRLIEGTGLSGTDRLLGMVFGFARGVLLVTLMVFLMGFTAFTRDPWYQQSVLLPQFKGVAAWLGERVPDNVKRYLQPSAVLDHLPSMPAMPSLQSLPALPAMLPGAAPAPARSSQAPATTGAAPATNL